MEVHLNSDLQAKLIRLAEARGRDAEMLAREAIERFVNYDEWFIREVEGVASADRSERLTHEEVSERLEKCIAEKRPEWLPKL